MQGTKINSKGKEVPHGTRLYSIAASRYGDTFDGKTTSLCVRRAEYWCPELKANDPAKKGLCSNYLCDAKPGDEITMTGEADLPDCLKLSAWAPPIARLYMLASVRSAYLQDLLQARVVRWEPGCTDLPQCCQEQLLGKEAGLRMHASMLGARVISRAIWIGALLSAAGHAVNITGSWPRRPHGQDPAAARGPERGAHLGGHRHGHRALPRLLAPLLPRGGRGPQVHR